MKTIALALAACLGTAALAQTEPPAGALSPDGPRLRASVEGGTFNWHPGNSGRTIDGVTARIEYRVGGLVYATLSDGSFDTGTWSLDGGRLCVRWQKFSSGCNDIRIAGNTIWLQHSNGKWSYMNAVVKAATPKG